MIITFIPIILETIYCLIKKPKTRKLIWMVFIMLIIGQLLAILIYLLVLIKIKIPEIPLGCFFIFLNYGVT